VSLWSLMCRLTGAKPPSKPTDRTMAPIDITHLWQEYEHPSEHIFWILVDVQELVPHGFRPPTGCDGDVDEQLFLSIDPSSIHFQADTKRNAKQPSNAGRRRVEPSGQLDPSIDVILADVLPISGGAGISEGWLALVSAPYLYPSQYMNATPDALLQRLYFQKLVPDDSGRTYGDLVSIDCYKTKRLVVYSASKSTNLSGPVLIAGAKSEYVVRVGMGVAVQTAQPAVSGLAVLHGLVVAISNAEPSLPVISVQIALVRRNLPAFMNWKGLGEAQALQTRLIVQVSPTDIVAVHRIMPYALYQHTMLPSNGSTPGSFDLGVTGNLDFGNATELTDALSILNAWHGFGAYQVGVKLSRVTPLPAKEALGVIAKNCLLFGITGPGMDAYRYHIGAALHSWALRKTGRVRNTAADNTLHLQIPGCLFACMLHELVPWGPTVGMTSAVSLDDGVLMVTLPDFQTAAGLLQRDNGLFDFTEYGRGFLQLYAPIVFKWEMYDTGRSSDESRSVEGFVAITFAHYVQRNCHNNFEIYSTLDHQYSACQLRKRPSECPHS